MGMVVVENGLVESLGYATELYFMTMRSRKRITGAEARAILLIYVSTMCHCKKNKDKNKCTRGNVRKVRCGGRTVQSPFTTLAVLPMRRCVKYHDSEQVQNFLRVDYNRSSAQIIRCYVPFTVPFSTLQCPSEGSRRPVYCYQPFTRKKHQ